MKKVSISETKANLSKYIRYVSTGHRVEILDRGRTVAYLVRPTALSAPKLSQLIADGLVRAKTQSLEWLCDEPVESLPRVNLSSAVSEDRKEST
jgi:antitoxin (DNA-binding transcriptional repressor) of toxin-antitoxin stability system